MAPQRTGEVTGVGEAYGDLVLAAMVAHRHYILGQSRVEIADAVGCSRFKVARLLESARAAGVVRIEILPPDGIDVSLSARLQDRFGLAHAAVVGTVGESGGMDDRLGLVAAHLLDEVLEEGQTLGLPWSRSVYRMVGALQHLPRVDVVQLTGAMDITELDSSAVDLVRRAARVSGGEAHLFFAPFVLGDRAAAEVVRRDTSVTSAYAAVPRVGVAVVGIGDVTTGSSTIHAVATEEERSSAAGLGAVGEIAGVFFDDQGRLITPPIADRLITLDPEALAAIPEVIGIVAGRDKLRATRAALRGELLRGLVCDVDLAEALLGDASD